MRYGEFKVRVSDVMNRKAFDVFDEDDKLLETYTVKKTCYLLAASTALSILLASSIYWYNMHP